ncbi:hypothetical protein [Gudongella sp. SC589]|jgi:hypothetical protein|uniref:hypothetical protein n=1 Tax=Gudongella sp. SC589 TaxID=3385990 RepID=UPI00390467E0
MNNFKSAISGVFRRAAEAFQTYPSAMGNALLFALVSIVKIHMDWEIQREYSILLNSLQWGMAVGAIWSLTAITWSKSRYNTSKAFTAANIFGFAVTAVTFILLYLFGEIGLDTEYRYLSSISQSRASIAIAIGLVVFVYLASFPRKESDFARSFFMTHKAFVVAALYGAVLMMGASGVAGAIQALLYNDMSNKVFQYIAVIAGFMTFSIFIGYFPDFRKDVEDPRRHELQEQPRFVQVLLGYILVPILLALTLVLLLWTVRTVMSGVGSSFIRLSGIAASYALGGIWLHIMVTRQDNGLVNFFKKIYPFTALVILAFEAWALIVQLNDTGLKTIEYNFIMVWIFTVISVLLLIFMKQESHRKIALVGSLIAAIAVLPVVGYHALPVKYQINRLEKVLISEGMLQNGQIVPATTEPGREVREDITDAVSFLSYRENKNLPDWFDDEIYNDKEFENTFGFKKTWPESDMEIPRQYLSTNLVLQSGVVEIDDYDWAVSFRDYYGSEEVRTEIEGKRGTYSISWISTKEGNPELNVELDGELILEGDFEGFFEDIVERYPPGARAPVEASIEEMSFVMESDELKVLVVFGNLEIGLDTTNNRKNQWFMLSGMYIEEK